MASSYQRPRGSSNPDLRDGPNPSVERSLSNSASNLADEVVKLMEELENEKKSAPAQKKVASSTGLKRSLSSSTDGGLNLAGDLSSPSLGTQPRIQIPSSTSTSSLESIANDRNSKSLPTTPARRISFSNDGETHNLKFSSSYSNLFPSSSSSSSLSSNSFAAPSSASTKRGIPTSNSTPKYKSSWSNALSSFSSSTSPRKSLDIESVADLKRRINQLEEEVRMADSFKRSLKETLGLQVESLRMDLDLERERTKRLEYELAIRTEGDFVPRSSGDIPLSPIASAFHSNHNSSSSYPSNNSLSPTNSISIPNPIETILQPIISKLKKIVEEEKRDMDQMKSVRVTNSKVVKEHEENIKRLVSQMKEESIFLISMREQKSALEKSNNYQYRGAKPDAQLGGKLAISEANMKRLNEEMEKEKKIINDLETVGYRSTVDKKLEHYSQFHQQLEKALKSCLEEGSGGQIKKQLDEVTALRESEREYYENQSRIYESQRTIFEKQVAELTSSKESLEEERSRIIERYNREKDEIKAQFHQEEIEYNRLQNQLRDEKNKEIAELKRELDQLRSEFESAQAQLENLRSENEKLRSEILTEETKEKELLHQLTTVQSEDSTLRSKLSEETKSHLVQIAAEEESKAKLIEESKRLLAKLEEESIARRIVEEESKALLAKLNDVTTELSNTKMNAEEVTKVLKMRVDEITKELDDLRINLEEQKKETASMTAKKLKLQEQFNNLRSMLSSVDT